MVIILLAHPAQITGFVIAGVAVNVIDGSFFFWIIIRAERLCYQSADKIMLSFPAAGQADTIISFVIFEWREQLRRCVLQALDAPHI